MFAISGSSIEKTRKWNVWWQEKGDQSCRRRWTAELVPKQLMGANHVGIGFVINKMVTSS